MMRVSLCVMSMEEMRGIKEAFLANNILPLKCQFNKALATDVTQVRTAENPFSHFNDLHMTP